MNAQHLDVLLYVTELNRHIGQDNIEKQMTQI